MINLGLTRNPPPSGLLISPTRSPLLRTTSPAPAKNAKTTTVTATMRLEVASISSNPAPASRVLFSEARKPTSAAALGRRQAKTARVRAGDSRSRAPARTVGCPEPPWLVLPPSRPENPFSSKLDLHVNGTDIPLSIRMVQLKKRMTTTTTTTGVESPLDDALVKAISAVVLMIGELQRWMMANSADEAVQGRISRDRRDSLLWLFRRVFFSSPDLVVSLLLLLADFVSFSAQKAGAASVVSTVNDDQSLACAAISKDMSAELAPERAADWAPELNRLTNFLSWFDIGVKEGALGPPLHHDEESCVDRRRRAYERTIAEGEANSMILSNYAQFLYRIANDHDRAEQYFQWAVMAEPRDAEAMSRYATFLWEERGDITGAEEMFLEAIEAEPWNPHHSSSYAWFLWKTGALDTCYPLPLPSFPEA
ncbi:uncharacterized protein LOC144699991 [Wolffia australiana]